MFVSLPHVKTKQLINSAVSRPSDDLYRPRHPLQLLSLPIPGPRSNTPILFGEQGVPRKRSMELDLLHHLWAHRW